VADKNPQLRIANRACFILLIFLLLFCTAPSGATEPVSITILTLDNRPPNNLFLKELAAVAGVDVTVSFVPDMAPVADCVSINAAVAGSLVGSRTIDPWKLDPPDVKPTALLHFAVPRIEPTVKEIGVADQYAKIREKLTDPDLQREVLDSIRNKDRSLDDPYLNNYVNRMRGWLDFLGRANYDPTRLLITLDDNRPGPLSDGLKLMLGKFSRCVYDGTDEGMMLLFARALHEAQIDPPTTCGIVWTDPGDLTAVMPVESGMVAENILTMASWLGMRITPRFDLLENWVPILWVNGAGSTDDTRADFAVATAVKIGDRPVIVADIAKTNKGDTALIQSWRENGTPPGLTGYVGWNSSSNTLGSAFALWVSVDFAYYHGADPEGVRAACETFLWARFLDDYLYQGMVRGERRDLLVAQGGDQFNLSAEQIRIEEAEIAKRITELWREMGEDLALPLRFVKPLDHTTFTVELPWSRFFEIELYPSDDRGILPVIRQVDSN
jgi:hypothetical protein